MLLGDWIVLYLNNSIYYLRGNSSTDFNCALSVSGGLSLADGDLILATATCNSNSSSELGSVFELSSVFPVDLTSFWVEAESDDALISWTTSSEQNSAYFQVERSVDAKAYLAVGQVQAAGQSSEIQEYQFRDKSLVASSSHRLFYRLRQVDEDGAYRFSTVEIFSPLAPANFKVQVLENPIRESIRLKYSSPKTEILTINILNLSGQTVYTNHLESQPDERQGSIKVSDWARGVYTLLVYNGKESLSQKIVLP